MNSFKNLALPVFAAVVCLGAANVTFAREASEAPRGQDNGRHGGKAIDVPQQLMAREAGEAPRGQDHGRRGGKAIDVPEQLMAREAGEAPRGQDHGRRGGKAIESMERDAA
ncbi:MAG: hypothetical protein JWP60_4369 [Ramlibacter sp.]|nr:hypothetical protein [Ramlibacter sp.]